MGASNICSDVPNKYVLFLFLKDNTKNIVMNRIAHELESYELFTNEFDFRIFEEKFIQQYGEKNYPQNIYLFSLDQFDTGIFSKNHTQQYIFPVTFENSNNIFLIFEYPLENFTKTIFALNLFFIVIFLITLLFILFVTSQILKPFLEFQKYPERLALGQITEKLPETKNKFFGKYIWAMNMLGDVLENERKKVIKLNKDKQVLTSTLAHGIKTPISNIKLYANAIQTGLYSHVINEKDAEIAAKIEKNADDIQQLVTNILDTSINSIFDFEPRENSFYMAEIKDFIITEYENKFLMNKIPYTIEQNENPLIKSDKEGICKILYQLLDNAIKYGDGTGIQIKLERQGENFYFSVVNNGVSISENEIPFLFNSFWRGSNASNKEGQGIGLYEAKIIAKKLGGNLFVTIKENKFENNLDILLNAIKPKIIIQDNIQEYRILTFINSFLKISLFSSANEITLL